MNWLLQLIRLLFLVIGFLFISATAFAVSDQDQYWEKNSPDILTVKIGNYSPGSDFSMNRQKNYGVTFIPGSADGPYAEVSYGEFALSYHQAAPSAESIQKRGESDFKDFQFRFFGHRNSWEILHQKVSGFVLQDWDLTQPGARRPDLSTTSTQLNFFQVLSPKYFSKAITYNQEGFQLQAGGSSLFFASLGNFRLIGDSELVPATLFVDMGESGRITSLSSRYLMAGFGYGYIYPFYKRFFMSLSGLLGYGLRDLEYSMLGSSKKNVSSTFRQGLRMALGYNYGDWIVMGSLLVDGNTWGVAESEFQQAGYAVKLIFGYRIRDIDIPLLRLE